MHWLLMMALFMHISLVEYSEITKCQKVVVAVQFLCQYVIRNPTATHHTDIRSLLMLAHTCHAASMLLWNVSEISNTALLLPREPREEENTITVMRSWCCLHCSHSSTSTYDCKGQRLHQEGASWRTWAKPEQFILYFSSLTVHHLCLLHRVSREAGVGCDWFLL